MNLPPFKNALSAAMMVSAIAAAPSHASAEIKINTDTGVTVEDLERAGVRPETRLIMPGDRQALSGPVLPNARPARENNTATVSSLVDENLPDQSSITPSTVISNTNRDVIRNQMLNTTDDPGMRSTMDNTLSETNTTLSRDLGDISSDRLSRDSRSSNVGGETTRSLRNSANMQPYSHTYTDDMRNPASQTGSGSANVGSQNRVGADVRSPGGSSSSADGAAGGGF